MPVPCRRLVPALALVAAVALAASHAHGQTAPPPELVTRALAAATGEARRSLVEAHPELGREPAFTAVRLAAAAEGKAQDPGRAFNAYRVLMDAAAAAGDDRRRIQMLLALGTLASQKGYVGLAEETLAEAAAYGERTGNPDIIIPAVNNLGITFLNQGRFDEARASYQRSYAAAEGAGRRDSMARSLNNIGDVATFQGDFRTALDYLTRSLALKETLGDEVAIARTSSNIGSIHLRQGSFDQALARFERALAVGQRLDNLQLQVGGAIDIALVRIAQGQPAAALTVLETARPLAERFGDPVLLGDLWQARGRASSQARRWSEARAALGTALTIQEASNNRAGQADTLLELASDLQAAAGAGSLTGFPGTALGTQLREVARLIQLRSQQGPGRQGFFVAHDGFDTHGSQDWQHWYLLSTLSQALSAFHNAVAGMGLSNKVTAFTQSEFGRTLQSNGGGSDHAWGNHHVVLGGAVQGGVYGQMPEMALGGPNDAGNRGVWIPTTSTSQFGATLGRWFGASEANLAWAFPTVDAFPTSNVGFMKSA